MSGARNEKSSGGRPPERDEAKRSAVAIRTTPKIKSALQDAADASGRSLTQEIEHRLERSIEMDHHVRGDQLTARLIEAIAAELVMVARWTGKRWYDDEVTFYAGRHAIIDAYNRFAPPTANEDELNAAISRRLRLTKEADALRQRLEPLGALPVANALLAYTPRSALAAGGPNAFIREGRPRDAESYQRMADHVEAGEWTLGQGEDVPEDLRRAIAADLRRLGDLEADLLAAEIAEEEAWEPHDKAKAEGARLVREHRERLQARMGGQE